MRLLRGGRQDDPPDLTRWGLRLVPLDDNESWQADDATEAVNRGYWIHDLDDNHVPHGAVPLECPGAGVVRVAGMSHSTDSQTPKARPGQVLRLVADPTNIHDPNAVGVWTADRRIQVGWVPRKHSAEIAGRLAKGPLLCVS